MTLLAAKDSGKNSHVASHTTGSRRQLHTKRAAFKKDTTAPFFFFNYFFGWGRKKAEELLCRGNDTPVFVLVVPSQGDVFGYSGGSPSEGWTQDRLMGTHGWWHPRCREQKSAGGVVGFVFEN